MDRPSALAIRSRLLRWFDRSRRDLPWRRTKDPYRILIAEYLLQRTRVATGAPYYERFVARFPDVAALAAAPEEEVLRAWEGLGYYRRARHLHAAAQAIMDEYGGRIPSTAAALAELPGIGPYTAGAVASIAFGERVPAVDGNAVRVLARLYRIEEDVNRRPTRERIHALAAALVSRSRPGAFNQALMELGATVCTPARPACPSCPLSSLCLARAGGIQADLPRAAPRRVPTTVPVAFGLVRHEDRVLLVRRPHGGLLGGLWALPGGEIPGTADARRRVAELVSAQTGVQVRADRPLLSVSHAFSHRRWSGDIYRCHVEEGRTLGISARWASAHDLRRLPVVPFHREALRVIETRRPLETFGTPTA